MLIFYMKKLLHDIRNYFIYYKMKKIIILYMC